MTDFCIELKDKFPFARRMTAMSDLASSCCIAGDGALGINEVHLSHNRQSVQWTDSLCRVEFTVGGEIIQGKLESHHYPHGLEQTFKSRDFECRAFTCFDAVNTPVIHLDITSAKKLDAVIYVSGHITPRDGASGDCEFDSSSGTLFIRRTEPKLDDRDPSPTFDACAAVKPGFIAEEIRPPGEGSDLQYRLTSKPIVLNPGVTFHTFVALPISTREREFRHWADARLGEVIPERSAAEEKARSRWNAIFASAPKPKIMGYRDLYYHSIYVLHRSLHFPTGKFGSHYASFPSIDHYDAHWLWDGAFHAIAFAEYNMSLAKDSILILIENQLPDGRIPHFVTADWIQPTSETQPPILAWAAWKMYKLSADKVFLDEVYEPLALNTVWWMKNRDKDGDGLLEWAECLETGWDNSPRWDSEYGVLESCDLNSWVLMQMKVLADMADELGRPVEATDWRREAEALGKRMAEKLYSPEDNIFYEVKFDTHQPVKLLTPAAFLPLWAGVPLETNKANAMIRDYLLNPVYFFGKVPFPTVAYNEPKYDSAGYWRGPTWINIAYFMVEVLQKYGFHDEAEQAVKRLLDVGAGERYIWEYYDSKMGKGLGAQEFGWSGALFIEMLLERFKQPE